LSKHGIFSLHLHFSLRCCLPIYLQSDLTLAPRYSSVCVAGSQLKATLSAAPLLFSYVRIVSLPGVFCFRLFWKSDPCTPTGSIKVTLSSLVRELSFDSRHRLFFFSLCDYAVPDTPGLTFFEFSFRAAVLALSTLPIVCSILTERGNFLVVPASFLSLSHDQHTAFPLLLFFFMRTSLLPFLFSTQNRLSRLPDVGGFPRSTVKAWEKVCGMLLIFGMFFTVPLLEYIFFFS